MSERYTPPELIEAALKDRSVDSLKNAVEDKEKLDIAAVLAEAQDLYRRLNSNFIRLEDAPGGAELVEKVAAVGYEHFANWVTEEAQKVLADEGLYPDWPGFGMDTIRYGQAKMKLVFLTNFVAPAEKNAFRDKYWLVVDDLEKRNNAARIKKSIQAYSGGELGQQDGGVSDAEASENRKSHVG